MVLYQTILFLRTLLEGFSVLWFYERFVQKSVEEPTLVQLQPNRLAEVPMENRRDAVRVRNASKAYGQGDSSNQVLRNLDLTVKEGSIYSLLGSSGCGKTTLLSCIVGMDKLDSGECRIFGKKPGTPGCGVPGKKIGYMPQETALYIEFTIKEAMYFFGRLNGMSLRKVKERMEFLVKLLNLPNPDQYIRKLSGGQQRRVSFAVALLHEPQILILDEPTVGVDPILRKSIWKYLRELVDAGKTTVIITTHYIEEANEANRIGLMRNGRLLAEDTPAALLQQNQSQKLEDVFFNLCQNDTTSDEFGTGRAQPKTNKAAGDAENVPEAVEDSPEASSMESNRSNENDVVALCNEKAAGSNEAISPSVISPSSPNFNRSVEQLLEGGSSPQTKDKKGRKGKKVKKKANNGNDKSCSWFNCFRKSSSDEESQTCVSFNFLTRDYWDKLSALLLKNFLVMYRNIGFVAFIFVLPAVQAALFCVAIGGDPTDLPLGVVNLEVPGSTGCNFTNGCSVSNMSCSYIKHIPKTSIELIQFCNMEEAQHEVEQGNIWGYIVIPRNYSEIIIQSGISGDAQHNVYEDSFQGTHVQLYLDMTSQQIAFAIQRTLGAAYQSFTTDLLFQCGMNSTMELPPLKGAKPLYGKMEASFSEFMAPGIILSIIFFMSVALTGSAFITERKEGMLKRSLVSGVETSQIMLSQMLTQYFVMMGQTLLVLAVMTWVFQVRITGSVLLAIALTVAQGTCGMSFGFLISCICADERNAIQMALGSFYPNLLLSGVVWPLESIPSVVRTFASFLPQTQACEAMRSIFSRGWGFTHPKVWPGFVISAGWAIVFWSIAAILISRRQR